MIKFFVVFIFLLSGISLHAQDSKTLNYKYDLVKFLTKPKLLYHLDTLLQHQLPLFKDARVCKSCKDSYTVDIQFTDFTIYETNYHVASNKYVPNNSEGLWEMYEFNTPYSLQCYLVVRDPKDEFVLGLRIIDSTKIFNKTYYAIFKSFNRPATLGNRYPEQNAYSGLETSPGGTPASFAHSGSGNRLLLPKLSDLYELAFDRLSSIQLIR